MFLAHPLFAALALLALLTVFVHHKARSLAGVFAFLAVACLIAALSGPFLVVPPHSVSHDLVGTVMLMDMSGSMSTTLTAPYVPAPPSVWCSVFSLLSAIVAGCGFCYLLNLGSRLYESNRRGAQV